MPLLTMLVQEAPPDRMFYLILGYVIIGAVGLGYMLSLVWRQRSLLRELEVLEQLQDGE